MGLRQRFAAATFAGMLALSAMTGFAADSTPASSPAATPEIKAVKAYMGSADNTIIGYAEVTPATEGVEIHVYSETETKVPAGDYTISISEFGYCDASVGFMNAGKLTKVGSVTVWDDGTYDSLVAAKENTLAKDGTGALQTSNGSAIVYTNKDDQRVACGIVSRTQDTSKLPAASPVASPAAATPKA